MYRIFIMIRKCLILPDTFSYMSGKLTYTTQRTNFTPLIKKDCELYFGCKVGDQDKSWTPDICCITCVSFLTG